MTINIPKERFELFGKILVTILARLGHPGKIVGHIDEGETIIFQFRQVENLDAIYPSIQDDGYDILQDTVAAKTFSMRKFNGNLELRYPSEVVFWVPSIIHFNPKLEMFNS